MRLAEREVGPDAPVFIIAELSANHNGRLEEALRLVELAKEAGADAVKLQTYTADTLTLQSDDPIFRVGGGTLWDGRTLYDLYAEASTPWAWHGALKARAEELGMLLFSSPFDPSAVDFLESLQVPAYKIASPELVDLPLIERVARTGKPLIMSTGMATLGEIEDAVTAARRAGCRELALLKCTSAYPADPAEMQLRTIPHLAQAFDVIVGLSDHTMGVSVPVAAVALGARIVEKHFTASRAVPGPDSAFSLEPHEFREMVTAIRTTEQALGQIHYGVNARESATRIFRRSLFVVADVKAGELLTADNVRSIRPGHGLPPKHLPEVLGRRAAVDLKRGSPLSWAHIR